MLFCITKQPPGTEGCVLGKLRPAALAAPGYYTAVPRKLSYTENWKTNSFAGHLKHRQVLENKLRPVSQLLAECVAEIRRTGNINKSIK